MRAKSAPEQILMIEFRPMIEFFNPSDAPMPVPSRRATRAAGLVFVSARAPATNRRQGARGTAAEQTRWALEHVAAILAAAGSSLERVVQ